MSQGSFSPKIRFLCQKLCSVARTLTDTKVNTEGTLSGFQDFSNFPSTYHQINQGAVQYNNDWNLESIWNWVTLVKQNDLGQNGYSWSIICMLIAGIDYG